MKSLILVLLLLLLSFTPVLAQVPPINMNGTLNLHGSLNLYQLPDPSAPIIKQVGQGGYTHYTYVYFCNDGTGYTTNYSPSAFVSGPATLNGSNNNQIQYSCPIGSASASIVRTDGSLQYVSKTASPQGFVVDQGVYTGTATLPSSNTTGIFYGNGSGLTNISGGGSSPLTGVVVQSTPGGPTLFNSTNTAGNTMSNGLNVNNSSGHNDGLDLNVGPDTTTNNGGAILNLATPMTALGAPPWSANRTYPLGVAIVPIVGNANLNPFQVVVAGKTSAGPVTWPQTPGDTVVDGEVTWKNVGWSCDSNNFPPDWHATYSYPANTVLFPDNGCTGNSSNPGSYLYQISASCVSGSTDPVSWDQTVGHTVSDGTCTWTNIGFSYWASQNPSLGANSSYDIGGVPVLTVGSSSGYFGDNLAVGIGAMAASAQGQSNSNVAVGWDALSACVYCQGDVAVGDYALRIQNSAGDAGGSQDDTAIGQGAMQRYNAASGFGGAGGLGSTAVGFDSLNIDTTGADNEAFGVYSCAALTTGSNNVCIGESGNISTGSGNILLGNSLADTVATTSNQLDIGDTIEGTVGGGVWGKFGMGGSKPAHLAVFGSASSANEGLYATQDDSAVPCVAGVTAAAGGTTHCAIYSNGSLWKRTGL